MMKYPRVGSKYAVHDDAYEPTEQFPDRKAGTADSGSERICFFVCALKYPGVYYTPFQKAIAKTNLVGNC
jgi:hypothetical protein